MTDEVGLCASCEYSRVLETARGSRFFLCRRSESDPRFRKYPPLPMLRCVGYVEIRGNERETQPPAAASND